MVVDAEQCQIKYDVIEIPLVDWRTEGLKDAALSIIWDKYFPQMW